MFTKWISCGIPDPYSAEFAAAQAGWSVIQDAPGLLGQVGGWAASGSVALILGLWSDQRAYDRFMAERHDEVLRSSAQASTYTSIEIATGESLLTMPGSAASPSDAILSSRVLRVADCTVRAGHEEHFTAVQENIWAPAMRTAGMRGGLFSHLGGQRYLVTTFWPDSVSHERYTANDVPSLRRSAAVDEDLEHIAGHVVALEPSWQVIAIHSVQNELGGVLATWKPTRVTRSQCSRLE